MPYDYHNTFFGGLSKGAQIVLLLIPGLHILSEIIIRIGAVIGKRTIGSVICALFFIVGSVSYIVNLVDALSINEEGVPFCI